MENAYSYYNDDSVKVDVSPVLDSLLLKDTTTLSQFAVGKPATNVKHEWVEDELASDYVTLTADYTDGDLSISVSATDSAKLYQYDILRPEGANWLCQVTDATPSGTSVTVTEDYGSTTTATYDISDKGSKMYIVARGKIEGADLVVDDIEGRDRSSNYTQIFEKGLQFSGSMQELQFYAVEDEMSHQIVKKTMLAKRSLNMAVLLSYKHDTPQGSSSATRTMDGLIAQISASGGNSTTTEEALTESVMNQLNQDVFDDGGVVDTIICGPYQARQISSFNAGKQRVPINEHLAGTFVNAFLFDLGNTAKVIVDRWCPKDTIIFVEKGRVFLVPLGGRRWNAMKLAITGDSQKWMLVGEWTLEVRHATKAHGIHTNLTYS